MYFFIAKLGFAEDFRFQLKLHELFHPLALHENFRTLLVNSDTQLIFLGKAKRIRLLGKLEAEVFKQSAKLRCLLQRQHMRVRIHSLGRERLTLNVQRPTLNSEFEIGRWAPVAPWPCEGG